MVRHVRSAAVCALAMALLSGLTPSLARAAESAPDTGKVCAVNLSAPARPGESLNTPAGIAAAARAVQAMHCQAGDILQMSYSEADPTPVMAQLCDFGRQIHIYNPPPSYAQVGISSELVCALAEARRTSR